MSSAAVRPRSAAQILPDGYAEKWAEVVIEVLGDELGCDIALGAWKGYGPGDVVMNRRVAIHAMTSVFGLSIAAAGRALGYKCISAQQVMRQHRVCHERNNPANPLRHALPELVAEAEFCDGWRQIWRELMIEDVLDVLDDETAAS